MYTLHTHTQQCSFNNTLHVYRAIFPMHATPLTTEHNTSVIEDFTLHTQHSASQ
uniref:Uncharacterized protein n=1 Tax=Anguilla anguilla TaxID=7936 RepID=A0A0E9VJ11_ANGAN